MDEDFYETLGVGADASADDIESAYRERVKETHPDVSDADGTAEEFKRVVRAEEVLGDVDERARYDRLGHDEYVSRVDGYGEDVDGDDDDHDGPDFAERWRTEWTEADEEDDGASHHARQRARRRASWFTGDASGGTRSGDAGQAGGRTGGSGADAGRAAGAGGGPGANLGGGPGAGGAAGAGTGAGQERDADATSDGGFGVGGTGWAPESSYSVHDWEDGDLEEGPVTLRLTQETLLLVVAMFMLYPIFLYSAFTPMFPLVVNLFVGACTLVVMGYLLTIPRAGAAVFGAWSGLTTFAMLVTGWGPFSLSGMVALLATYVPFGYSLLVAQVLRE